jgi:drug/metabolite transporter (DMT)-like permease
LAGIFLALTWIFLSRSLKLGTASYMTMMSTLTPIIVSILAVLLLGEQMTASQIFGSGLILLAGVLIFFSDIAYQ